MTKNKVGLCCDNLYHTGMKEAQKVKLLSDDPNTQVGSIVMRRDGKIIGQGYNRFPKGSNQDDFTWEREGEFLKTKYPYVVHAEIVSMMSATESLSGAVLFVTLFPCNDCAKAIAEAGIVEVVYTSDKYALEDNTIAAKTIFDKCSIKYTKYSHKEMGV